MEESHLQVDHLFRHQSGKMVSILTRAFGIEYLSEIEDAVQDTFAKAVLAWRLQMPENPEGWLVRAAKNRMIDLLRKLKSDGQRLEKLNGPAAIAIDTVFSPDEIADSQLAMIYTACHPSLSIEDKVAFALKTISGFSEPEISAALLTKRETIKKRLQRARKTLRDAKIQLIVPTSRQLETRLSTVLQVIYYIYNEGYHSIQNDELIREDLCHEAIRLCKIVIDTPTKQAGEAIALLALMYFHTARFAARLGDDGQVISLRDQDRSKWNDRLIRLGHTCMKSAIKDQQITSYHIQAAISAEHCKAETYDATNWSMILYRYQQLAIIEPSPMLDLNIAIVQLEAGLYSAARQSLDDIKPQTLDSRSYLLHATYAEYHKQMQEPSAAATYLQLAIDGCPNKTEKTYFAQKLAQLQTAT